jgi:Carboxypeptidase regulatory-like domain
VAGGNHETTNDLRRIVDGPDFNVCTRFGSIGGTVADPSGALVPGVRITATEVGTNLSRSAISDEQGRFVIPSLRPALYDLIAELPGFRNFTQRGMTLLADQSIAVNVKLQVGTASETVTVESAPPW